MASKLRIGVISISLVVVLYVLIGGVLGQTSGEGAYRQLAVFSEVLGRIRSEYVESPDMTRVTAGALHGLLESLDPYSAYLTPREFEEYQEHRGKSGGEVGLVLTKRGYVTVIAVLPDSPAERADLRTGDRLESIAGFTTYDMAVEQAYMLLEGEPGTTVSLSVIKPTRLEPLDMELARARPKPSRILSSVLEEGVGYAKVPTLSAGRADELRIALTRLQARGAERLVLDLRNCAAGEPEEGIRAARLFLDSGLVAYTRGQQIPREDFPAQPDRVTWKGPMVVLTNHGTAGPAEIVAAALQENNRAEVVGLRTIGGKGSVQRVIPLDDGAALILSVAKYYSPSGRALQDVGVVPTVTVEQALFTEEAPLRHALPAPGDPVVLKALEILRNLAEKKAA